MEDEEDDEDSSDNEHGLNSPRDSWSSSTTSGHGARPLNPDCQEFHPPAVVESPVVPVIPDASSPVVEYYAEWDPSGGYAATSMPQHEPNPGVDYVPIEPNAAGEYVTEFYCEEATEDCIPQALALGNHADNEPIRLTSEDPQQTQQLVVPAYEYSEAEAAAVATGQEQSGAYCESLTNGGGGGEQQQHLMVNGDLVNGELAEYNGAVEYSGAEMQQYRLRGSQTWYPSQMYGASQGMYMESQRLPEDQEQQSYINQMRLAAAAPPPRRRRSRALKIESPDLVQVAVNGRGEAPTKKAPSSVAASSEDDDRSVEEVTVLLRSTSVADAPQASQTDGVSGECASVLGFFSLYEHSNNFFDDIFSRIRLYL